jgi:transcription elongation factor GreA
MNTTTTYLSKKGMKELKRSIDQLGRELKTARQELREITGEDREDRFARSEKLSIIEGIESDLVEKRELLSHAQLFPRKRDALKVALGSVVELADQQGRLMRYTIVNSFEADPSDGRISILSPLGQSLVGKSVQQTIEWTSGKLQKHQLQLVAIH